MTTPQNLADAGQLARSIENTVSTVLVGQQQVVREVLLALISSGHVLLEGVPGLGKTLLVRTLSHCLQIDFARIQFTPDLMPTDVTGHAMFDQKTEQFRIRKGPAFTQLLLADEINRASAKTQSALLEVMQERQITIEGKCFTLEQPFMVLATQNPLDQEGTYPLPEAQLDRFL
ncbi:MAG: AAA family ATPase, partial [Alcanivoracaceae bacterium]|nr:AAA family ATPase [Alcanivoracaceae bacterium]